MPSSAVRRFADPDQYVGAVRATTAQFMVVGTGPFAAKLTRIDLHHLWMQRFEESVSRVVHLANMPGRAPILFSTGVGAGPVDSGVALDAGTIVRYADGETSFQHSAGPTAFASMSLPIEQLAAAGAVLAGADLAPPVRTTALRPSASALARLQRLHAAAGRLAEQDPAVIADPRAALALEQDLVQAMIACLAGGATRGDSAASRRHNRIMRRFHELVEASGDESLHIVGLCTQLNVSDRTLRACCQEYFGMPPHRYLWMRRMNIARKTLLRAEPGSTTVTEVAMASGFWELGRFAVGYRELFGESPSASLRRSPGR